MEIHPAQIAVPIPQQQKRPPRYKSFAQIILIVINLSLSNFYFGYNLVYISTIPFDTLIRIFSITMPKQIARGVLTGCIPIGAGFGALLARKLIHLFSRRNSILVINTLAIIVGSLIFINKMEVLIIMRFLQGFCVGLYTSTIPMYIAQITPVQILGSTGPFTQIFCTCGSGVAYLFYYILSISISQQNQDIIWYFVFGFPLIILILQTLVLIFIFPYQTPKYFLFLHSKKKARNLIAQLYKEEYVQTIYHEKIQDLQLGKNKQARKQRIREGKQLRPGIPQIRLSSKISLSSALSGIQIQQPPTSSTAIFAALHLMILRQFVGINAVLTYGGDIIAEAILNMRAIVPIFLNFQVMAGSLTAICLLNRIGRKTLLQVGTLILASSLVLITIGFFILSLVKSAGVPLIIIGLIIFTYTFGLTYGAIIWSYVSEIVQPSYTVLAIMITWIFASIVLVLFPILKNSILGGNPAILFLFFSIWASVSYFINRVILVQTNGKTEHQIHQQYNEIKISKIFKCFKFFKCFKREISPNEMTQSQLLDLQTLNLPLPRNIKIKKLAIKQSKSKQEQQTNKKYENGLRQKQQEKSKQKQSQRQEEKQISRQKNLQFSPATTFDTIISLSTKKQDYKLKEQVQEP